jgi:hypothetical protein
MQRVFKLVMQALISGKGKSALRRAIAEMASDPAILAENAAITQEFTAAQSDGLANR